MFVAIMGIGKDGARTLREIHEGPDTRDKMEASGVNVGVPEPGTATLISFHATRPGAAALTHGNYANGRALRKFCASKGWREDRDGPVWEWAHKNLMRASKVFIDNENIDMGVVTFKERLRVEDSAWSEIAQSHRAEQALRIKNLEEANRILTRERDGANARADAAVVTAHGPDGTWPKIHAQADEIKTLKRNVMDLDARGAGHAVRADRAEARVQELDTRITSLMHEVAHWRDRCGERSIVDHVHGPMYDGSRLSHAQTTAIVDENHRLKKYIASAAFMMHGNVVIDMGDADKASLLVRAIKAENGIKDLEHADDVIHARVAKALGLNPDLDTCTWETVWATADAMRQATATRLQWDKVREALGLSGDPVMRYGTKDVLPAIEALKADAALLKEAKESGKSLRVILGLPVDVTVGTALDEVKALKSLSCPDEVRRKLAKACGLHEDVHIHTLVLEALQRLNTQKWTSDELSACRVDLHRTQNLNSECNASHAKEKVAHGETRRKLETLAKFFENFPAAYLEAFLNDVAHMRWESVRTERHTMPVPPILSAWDPRAQREVVTGRTWELRFRA